MLHGNLGQEALESAPLVGRPAALPLVVVDDQDAIPGPSQGDRVVGEGVLPFPRFAVVEHLLGVGLAHVNDRKAVEMEVEDLRGSQDPGLRIGSLTGGLRPRPDRLAVGSGRLMVDLLAGGRSWAVAARRRG